MDLSIFISRMENISGTLVLDNDSLIDEKEIEISTQVRKQSALKFLLAYLCHFNKQYWMSSEGDNLYDFKTFTIWPLMSSIYFKHPYQGRKGVIDHSSKSVEIFYNLSLISKERRRIRIPPF